MTDTRVSVLTPPGTGAIATVAVVGPRAWEAVRAVFRPVKGSLPEVPPPNRVYSGVLGEGGDEVVVGVKSAEWVEVHCHGGRRVVRWVVSQLGARSAERGIEDNPAGVSAVDSTLHAPHSTHDSRALEPLTRAATVRVASTLLDQLNGAFDRAVEAILADWPNTRPQLERLASLAPLGRRLNDPPRVVIAGPPNVGKSSLLNALAGYQRSIVSPTAGTTRDVVGVELAFDGWPVRVSDTAGLRDAGEQLEAAGIELAERELATADLVVWVVDFSEPEPVWAPHDFNGRLLAVINKGDFPRSWGEGGWPDAWGGLLVSAKMGTGIPGLVAEIVHRLFPVVQQPGEAVPFTPELCEMVERSVEDIEVLRGERERA
jgi:tRNA modification GTPase